MSRRAHAARDHPIGSLSKYLGKWLVTGQVVLTPKVDGTNATYDGGVRY